MEIDNENMVIDNLKIAELASNLSKAQHELNIAQRINKRIFGELRMWKERSLKLENNLKEEKRSNQKNITQLGFKMLQFENHLRKEQRDIESKFIEKDNQIKVLEDVINSLHNRIKRNSLCYNCFVVKHNSPERCASPDSYAAKFPLDMDFPDHKIVTHGTSEIRSRSMSLPLNVQNALESPKPNNEFCFHHMLSPVPEELEVNVLEHAKRINRDPIPEESNSLEGTEIEVTETMQENEDKEGLHNEVTEMQDSSGSKMVKSSSENEDDISLTRDSTGNIEMNCENEEKVYASDPDLNGGSVFEDKETNVIDQGEEDGVILPLETDTVENEMYIAKQSERQQKIIEEEPGLNSEVHYIMNDIISRVESLMEHNQHLSMETTGLANQNPENAPEDTIEASENLNKKDGSKMPLSPKSEAIVAELKRAIFDASIEHEKKDDSVNEAASSNLEQTAVNKHSESKINCNEGAISQNEENVNQNEEAVIQNEESVNQNEENVNQIEEAIIQNEGAIIQNEENVNQNEETVIQIKENVNQNEETVSQNEETVIENVEAVIQNEESVNQNEENANQNEETIIQNEEAVSQNKESVRQNKETVNENKETFNSLVDLENNSDGSFTLEGDEKGNDIASILANSNEVDLALHNDIPLTKEDGSFNFEAKEDINPEVNKINTSVSENCVDTLTEYDVIELD